jgi:hypothetical protein
MRRLDERAGVDTSLEGPHLHENCPDHCPDKRMRRQDREVSIKAGADLFLERPVSADVLREHVVRLLVAGGRVSRESSGVVANNAQPAGARTCPQCRGLMEYRHKSPVLSAEQDSREPQDRLRYVSGWFCSDPACEYQELARHRG